MREIHRKHKDDMDGLSRRKDPRPCARATPIDKPPWHYSLPDDAADAADDFFHYFLA